MNLDMSYWKTFLLQDIFNIRYGANLELNTCEEAIVGDEINFVSRTESNNGVSAKVRLIPEVEPQKAGLITVAGGGSVLSTFVQNEPFYSGRDLYTLDAKENISDETKLFIITLIKANKYKYNYGRQANKTLPFIEIKLPVQHNKDGSITIDDNHEYSVDGYIPDWQFMEDYMKSLHHKPLTTGNSNTTISSLNCHNWKDFLLFDYFDILPGKYHYPDEYDEGTTPYYSASNENNGIGQYIDLQPDFEGNCIVTGKIGCTAFYVPEDFCATSDVNIFKPKFNMTNYVGLFIATVINFNENYKWAYGRQCRVGNSKKITIKLPVDTNGNPDWQFMEDYIKSLPYGDRI